MLQDSSLCNVMIHNNKNSNALKALKTEGFRGSNIVL